MTAVTSQANALRAAVDRVRKVLSRSDTVGRGTARTRARIRDGLTCEVVDGSWRLTVDMPEKVGGRGQGPDPGVLGRGALASCLAVGYAMWAAHEGVPLVSLEVEVEADYDARPEYGIGAGAPGYEALRWEVRVESGAPEEQVLQVLATAEDRSPWLAVFRTSQELQRTVRITSPLED